MAANRQKPTYTAGEWEIDLDRRELRARGVVVPLGARAFEILEVLVQSAGQLVTKDDFMHRIWPGAIIGDNTLQVHISAVRAALGSNRAMLKTAAGRGYRLLGSWAIRQESRSKDPVDLRPTRLSTQPLSTNLPVEASDLIGRAAALRQVQDLLSAYRVVTLSGPGGIGKTTLALAVARSLLATFEGDCWLVELGSLMDAALVPSAVAGKLGLRLAGGEISPEAVARAIAGRKLLLVLDNCEHLVDAAANLAETIICACPNVTVLATSREVLSIQGEYLYRVPSLEVPPAEPQQAAELLRHSAAQLLIAKTRALNADFGLGDETIDAIVKICRRLDGIPLAIEFAAARAAALGLPLVAARLDDRFGLLTAGRRTALPRHRTLRATLDWSYELLTNDERMVLRRLGVIASYFTIDAAIAISQDPGVGAVEVVNSISSLVAKSLITIDATGSSEQIYRLLETTRAYARDRLHETHEFQMIARRHAVYLRVLLERATSEWDVRPTAEWLKDYGHQIDDIRAALLWSFAPEGDPALGVALTIVAVPLWMQLSLVAECRQSVERALAHPAGTNARQEMQLWSALGVALIYTRGQAPETAGAWAQALAAAERQADDEYKLQALYGLWNSRATSGELAAAMEHASAFYQLAAERSDAADQLIGDRMIGSTLHFLGNQTEARRHLEHMLDRYVAPTHRSATMRYQFDQRAVVEALLARVRWVQGYPDLATRIAGNTLRNALATDQEISICYALVEGACPLALFTRDFGAADSFVTMLLDRAARHGLTTWHVLGLSLQGELMVKRGNLRAGLPFFRAALEQLCELRLVLRYPAFLGSLAEGHAAAGDLTAALTVIDQALTLSEQSDALWYLPELLNIKGTLIHMDAPARPHSQAEDYFRQALELARRQGALSWQLRAATNLARLHADRGRPSDGCHLLRSVYGRFTEGFETGDLLEARGLVNALAVAETR